ncbi:hydrolase 1, exosortase A system-associated [Ectothiorhodospira mobilis]|uniref:hydrolase 1, exosortase A system-associated n=1 Tax=Ectothiorhodospira mobilis TaxID=195064 RepID=UPI001905F530|nr:hydrolase 1, exosortase A system-associated [Ectothiorhodospira mobilis]MBK1692141.1 hydrolase 1, exosortase A system-associated [Ectothiorhodospira mobilis]
MSPDAFLFYVDEMPLVGMIHPGAQEARTGVLIIVGGPQYRVGSHRQFLLLARHLSAHGIPVMRFDYRGMGDSGGEPRDFEHIHEDIAAAVDAFLSRVPQLERVVLWGLCDAASAALLYAWRDPRVAGLVLLNPWVRTEAGLARAYLRGYYRQRLLSRAFWGDLLRGRVDLRHSLVSLGGMLRRAVLRGRAKGGTPGEGGLAHDAPLPRRMAEGWRRFPGSILLILSGEDLTAAEFRECATGDPAWRGLLEASRVTLRELPGANHTFSRREWREPVAQWTREWLSRWPDVPRP